MANYLWQFTSNNSTNIGGQSTTSNAVTPLPVLGPAGAGPNNISNIGNTYGNQLVNVVRDFYWTYSKPGDTSRAEVPKVILTERRLKTNALVAQLKYSLTNIANPASSIASNAAKTFGAISSVFSDYLGSGTVSKAITTGINATGSGVGAVANFTAGVATEAANVANSFYNRLDIGDNNPTVNSNPLLQPYQSLYITEPTNWVYMLPYFTDNQATQGNSFSDTGSPMKGILGGLANAAVEKATGLSENLSTLASPTQVTFVEKTKFFQYDSDGSGAETVDIEFPLINTGSVSYDDVVRNWQLLYLLIYQNRPGKTGINTVDQPVIYQVEIPGTKFFPYCYMQSINIDFVGSRREMPITVPSAAAITNSTQTSQSVINGTQTINTVIPDAYKVRITLKSLTANTRNFMAYMLSTHNIIETGTANSGPTTPSPTQAPGLITGPDVSSTPYTQSPGSQTSIA
jgi:hypothetical protein